MLLLATLRQRPIQELNLLGLAALPLSKRVPFRPTHRARRRQESNLRGLSPTRLAAGCDWPLRHADSTTCRCRPCPMRFVRAPSTLVELGGDTPGRTCTCGAARAARLGRAGFAATRTGEWNRGESNPHLSLAGRPCVR